MNKFQEIKQINSQRGSLILKAFGQGIEKAQRANHKYIRKEGDKYIYQENIKNAQQKRKENIIESSKEKIDSALSEGGNLYIYEKKNESKTKELEREYERLAGNAPIGNQNHPQTKRFNELRKLKLDGKLEIREPQYRIERPDGHIMILNKTEYEYAKQKNENNKS